MALYYKITFNEEFGLDNVPNDAEPYLSGATLNECTSMNNWLTLGGSASNRLKFNIKNAPVNNFEGARIALYIKDEPTPGADDASDISITIDNESTFLEDVEQIEELPLNDTAEDVDIENIEDIPGTVTDYELEPIIDESGDNDEIVENDNYRNESFDIQGEAAADVEPVTDLIKMGEFVITQVTQSNDETLSVTALDLLSLLNVTPELTTTTGYAQVIFDELKAQSEALDLVVNDLELPQMNITVPPLKTVRDLFGLFASLNGAYVCCDRNGVIDFRPYLKNDVYINYNEVKTFSTLCESTVNINSVACDISTSLIERNFIISGDDEEPEMIINNPWINQTILDSILSLYQYTVYQPANIVCNWNYQVETGDFIQVESAQGNPVWVCVTNQTISLDSGLTQIESRGESYELNAIGKEKPVDAKFKTLYSEMIEAKYIDADKVVADGLEANKADITDLVTDNLTVGSINGNVIQNGTVLAAALSQEAVQTIGGNKVYYQAEPPTGGTYVNGDTWYKTVIADTDTDKKVLHVWNGTTWEATDFDARILRANTITAQEIAANTIEAGNINMDNLQANLVRIGDPDGANISLDGEQALFNTGDAVNAIDANGMILSDPNGTEYFSAQKTTAGKRTVERVRTSLTYFSLGTDTVRSIEVACSVKINGTYQTIKAKFDWTPEGGNITGHWVNQYDRVVTLDGVNDWSISGRRFYHGIASNVDVRNNEYTFTIYKGAIQTQITLTGADELTAVNKALEIKKESDTAIASIDWAGIATFNGLTVNGKEKTYNGECVTLEGNAGTVTLSTSAANYLTGRSAIGATTANYTDVYTVTTNPATIRVKKSGLYMVKASAYYTTGFTVNDIVHTNVEKQTSGSTTWTTLNEAGFLARVNNASWYNRTDATGFIYLNAGDTVRMTAYNQTGARGLISMNGNTMLQLVKIY